MAAHVDSTSAQITTTSAVSCAKPAGLADTHTVYMAIFTRGSVNVASGGEPSGFDLIADATDTTSTNASGCRVIVYSRYVASAAGEPANYTATMDSNCNGCVIVWCASGVDSTSPVQIADFSPDASGSDAVINSPAVVTPADGSLVYELAAMNTTLGIGSWAATGPTEDEDVASAAATNRVSAVLGHRTQTTAGDTGGMAWTATLLSGTTYGPGAGVTIAVGISAAVASAGPDQTVEAGELVTIDCSASEGTISSRALTQVSGAVDVEDYLFGATTDTVTFFAPKPPTSSDLVLVLRETVTGPGNSDTDDVTITVTPSAGESLRVFILDENGDPT